MLRRKVEDDPEEKLTLFTLAKYAYSVIITNLSLTPYGVFTFYKDRAGLERIIRVLKNDFPFGSAPTGNFEANALYAELSLFAYNLVTWFKRLYVSPPTLAIVYSSDSSASSLDDTRSIYPDRQRPYSEVPEKLLP